MSENNETVGVGDETTPQTENVVIVETKRGRGRPKGSKNKPK